MRPSNALSPPGEEILRRLVALNAERPVLSSVEGAEEEKRGPIDRKEEMLNDECRMW